MTKVEKRDMRRGEAGYKRKRGKKDQKEKGAVVCRAQCGGGSGRGLYNTTRLQNCK